jgi:hypothetical protein
MRNYWHVWYDLSYDSIRATIRHIIFSVYTEKYSVYFNKKTTKKVKIVKVFTELSIIFSQTLGDAGITLIHNVLADT